MTSTALIIGLPHTCRLLERQLDLLDSRPITIGWLLAGTDPIQTDHEPVVGHVDELEAVIARRRPSVALISLPAVMADLVTNLRTRLRRLGVPERFMPTLEDQIAGVGPRTHLDIDLAALLNRPARRVNDRQVAGVIEGKRILITGAGGSIGSELSRIVSRFGPEQVLLMDRAENALFEIDRQIARRHPDLPRQALLHDVVDAKGTLALCRRLKPQVVFHAAAHKHVPMMEDHPGAAVDNNLFGTKSITDAADEVGAERFVMISTDKAVNPSSIMGATKRLAELYVQHVNQRSGTAFSIVRFGNVLGSAGSVLETWSKQIADGGPVTVTDPAMTRYFMTIAEAAALVIESAALVDPHAEAGEVFLLDMGEPIRIVEMARRFIDMHGLTPVMPGDEMPKDSACAAVVFTGARPGEKLHEELAFDPEAMRRTCHEDVNLWMLPEPAESTIGRMLALLAPGARSADPDEVAGQIRRLVPEMVRPVAA